MRYICFILLFFWGTSHSFAQAPGGIDSAAVSGDFLWLKANSTKVTLDPGGTKAISWQDENSNYTAAQASLAKSPLYETTYNVNNDFNFNPSVDFVQSSNTVLRNTSGSDNFMGTDGTCFVVSNTSGGNGTVLTYRGTGNTRYQLKPSWRSQNGASNLGYTFDFGTLPIDFGNSAARINTNSGFGSSSGFYRNASSYPLSLSGSVYYPAVQQGLSIGANTASEYVDDAVAEIIIYPTKLNNSQQNKVESYLAIKYGITLDSTSATTYVLSDSSIVWNHNAHPQYHHRLTALARDDSSALHQRQSRSVHFGGLLEIYYGNYTASMPPMNDSNTNDLLDRQFLIIGDDNKDLQPSICFASDYMLRIPRTWIARQSINYNDSTTIRLEKAAVSPQIAKLLVAQDPTFPTAMTTVYDLMDDGAYWRAEVLLGDSLFFTLATDSVSTTAVVTPSYCSTPSGTATVSSIGGGGSYTYTWATAPTQTGSTATGLPAGLAVVTIEHGNGCFVAQNVSIPSATYYLTVSAMTTDEFCTNSDGTITLKANNSGSAPYLYSIDGGSTFVSSNYFSGLPAGNYPILVQDSNGCTNPLFSETLLNIINPPTITYTIVEPICYGEATGKIEITATSGTGPFTYELLAQSISNSDGIFENLPAGSHLFTITGNDNCHLDTVITLNQPQKLVLKGEFEPSCWLDPTARVTLNAFGGIPSHEFSVDGMDFSSENILDSVSSGPHVFYVRDASGCIDSLTYTIPEYDSFFISAEVIEVDCSAWTSGGIRLDVQGTSGPYTYAWEKFPNQVIGPEKLDLTAGTYFIEVFDIYMCRDTVRLDIANTCCMPFVPNAFTPNGDGLNDQLEVIASPDMEIVNFEIFNRFGESIYYTLSQNPIWDGRVSEQDADIETYIWRARVKCTEGESQVSGSFHLLR